MVPARLTVEALLGAATLVDGGRPGHGAEGVPPAGPLVPEGLAAANRAVGNPVDAVGIELAGVMTLAGEGMVGTHGEVRVLRAGERWTVRSGAWRVGYVAVRGGLRAPRWLGSATPLPGGIEVGPRGPRGIAVGQTWDGGRRAGVPTIRAGARPCLLPGDAPIVLLVDPAWAPLGLLAPGWRVGAGDRRGLTLDGPRLADVAGGLGPSGPTQPGLVQLPPGGLPLVLGPDGPTTGGYPVVAEVWPPHLGSLYARGPGHPVTFRLVPRARPCVRS